MFVTEKILNDRKLVTARLIACGFEEVSSEKVCVVSPTGSKEMLRIFLALMASNKWRCNAIDIKSAFLQWHKLDRDVHLKPPSESGSETRLLKLNKCACGLNDSLRVWYFSVSEKKCGCIQSKYYEGKLAGLFLMYVDNFFGEETAHLSLMSSEVNFCFSN